MPSDTAVSEFLKTMTSWISSNLLNTERITQYGIVITGLVITFLLVQVINKKLELLPVKARVYRLRAILYRLMQRLAFPLIFIVWVFTFEMIYDSLENRHIVLTTVRSLSMAWLIIRFGSAFIENPFISRSVATVIWIIAALKIIGYLPSTIEYMDGITLGTEKESLSLYDVVSSALSVGAMIWLAMLVYSIIERLIVNNRNISGSAQALFSKLSKFFLITIAFLAGLKVVGISLTTFAVFGGAIGVGIGLGLQKVFSNLIAGIILLMDKSIKPGDTIVMNGKYGKVNYLSSRYVSMLTRDGIEQLVPNDDLINQPVENWSYSNNNVRLRIPIGVHYNSDINKAIALCIEAIGEIPRALKTPAPACLLKGFGDNSVDLELRFWINDPMNGCANIKSEALHKVWEKFHAHNIEIPYPQRDLHLVDSGSLNVSIVNGQSDAAKS